MSLLGYDWGNVLKAQVQATTVTSSNGKPKGPVPTGRYNARISAITHGTFKKGSYGVKITYAITDSKAAGRTLNEYIVLTKADGTAAQFGPEKLKRRLMTVLSSEQINNFKSPADAHDLGDFKLLFNEPVVIVVKEDAPFEGRPSRKIGGVYSAEEQAAA